MFKSLVFTSKIAAVAITSLFVATEACQAQYGAGVGGRGGSGGGGGGGVGSSYYGGGLGAYGGYSAGSSYGYGGSWAGTPLGYSSNGAGNTLIYGYTGTIPYTNGSSGPSYRSNGYYGATSAYPMYGYYGNSYQSFYPPGGPLGYQQEVQGNNTASIEVLVPSNAKLWFDDHQTKLTGPKRFFATPPLTGGNLAAYNLRAIWTDESGKQVTQTRRVYAAPNQRTTVNFEDGDHQAGQNNSTASTPKDRQ